MSRYTRVLAALGSVVAGIRHSCSGLVLALVACSGAAAPGKRKNARRSSGVLAALGSVVAGILHSCWHPQDDTRHARENAKTRVDRRSTRVSAFWARFRWAEQSQRPLERPWRLGTAGQPRLRRLGGVSSGLKFSARGPQPRQGLILPRRALHRLGLDVFLLEGSESSHGPCSKSRSWSCLAFVLLFDIFYSCNALAKQIWQEACENSIL